MGTNSYWIGFLTDNADVDLVMTHLAAVSILTATKLLHLLIREPDGSESTPSLGLQ